MSLSELYGFIVFNCGIHPDYFLDEMDEYEVDALYNAYNLDYRDGWEKVRTLVHSVISSQSSKPLKADKLLPFPWDKRVKEINRKITESDLERVIEKHKRLTK